jgi:hypothetical protein
VPRGKTPSGPDGKEPGRWRKVVRTFRDGHREEWWALEAEAGPYGTERSKRALVVTTDPEGLPDLATWYLTTNLPAPGSGRENESDLAPAGVEEVVRLYGLRMWVEQSYKQVKHARRLERLPGQGRHSHPSPLGVGVLGVLVLLVGIRTLADRRADPIGERSGPRRAGGEGKKEGDEILAGGVEGGEGVAGTVGDALALLEGVLRAAPTRGAKSAA